MTTIAFQNTFGVAITKYASSIARTTVDTTRTVFVWILSLKQLGMGVIGGKESFDSIQLLGFILLSLGSPIFNEILVIPFCGFKKYIGVDIRSPSINKNKKSVDNKKYTFFQKIAK